MTKNLVLKDKQIPSRLSIGDVRNAKAHHGIDLGLVTTEQDSLMFRFAADVVALSDIVWGLYSRRLKENGIISQEVLDEHLEESDLDEIRDVVAGAVQGFFPLLWTTYTAMKAAQSGNQPEAAEK